MKKYIYLAILVAAAVAAYLLFFTTAFTGKAAATPTHRDWSSWGKWNEWGDCKVKEDRLVASEEAQTCGQLKQGYQVRERTRTCESKAGHGINWCSKVGDVDTDKDYQKCEVVVNPCPTPELVCTQNCGTSPTFASSSTEAPKEPMCSNEKYDAPELQGYSRVTPTSVGLNWWKSTDSADKQFVVYGYAENQLVHATKEGEVGKNDGNYTVNMLEANKMAFFQVWSVKDGCVSKSQIIDP